jgi:hypothetical protein
LINLQELAVTKLDCSNPTLYPTNNDSSIANLGLSGFYFGPNAPVNKYDTTAPTIEVRVANGTPVQSIESAKLASVSNLPASSRKGHDIAGFPHSLIELAPFLDAGCCNLFTTTLVIAFDQDGKAILIGWQETTSQGFGAGPSSHSCQHLPTCP